MVMLEVYTKSIKVKYKSFLLSKATVIALSCGLVSIILPFIFCYETGGFWQKRDVVHEQPDVRFTGDFLLLATTNDNQKPISCSSFSNYNKYVQFLDNCSAIKVLESDENHDGKADFLDITITIKVAKNVKITSFHFILPLNYSLHLPCAFHTQSVIIYQQFILNSASKISIFGDLGIKQAESLVCLKYGAATNTDPPIVERDDQLQSYSLENIVARYAKSKIKTTFDNIFTIFNPIWDNDKFTISLTIKYPEHKIYYKPRLWQIMKFAWIQYIAMYVLISWIIFQIKRYIFNNNLVILYKQKQT